MDREVEEGLLTLEGSLNCTEKEREAKACLPTEGNPRFLFACPVIHARTHANARTHSNPHQARETVFTDRDLERPAVFSPLIEIEFRAYYIYRRLSMFPLVYRFIAQCSEGGERFAYKHAG